MGPRHAQLRFKCLACVHSTSSILQSEQASDILTAACYAQAIGLPACYALAVKRRVQRLTHMQIYR